MGQHTAPMEEVVTLVVVLLVLAVLFGLFGLFIEGLKWLLIIAAALIIASVVSNFLGSRSRA